MRLQPSWGRQCPPYFSYPLIPGHPLTEGLIGCWLLHYGASIYDHTFKSVGTRNGSNLLFNGTFGPAGLRHASTDSASYISFSASLYDFANTSPFSLEVWIYFTDGTTSTGRNLFLGNLEGVAADKGIFLDLNVTTANDVRFVIRNKFSTNEIDQVTATGATTTNAWNHLVVTYDGSQTAAGCKLYVNGRSVSFATVTTNNLSASPATGLNWCLGRSGNWTSTAAKSGTQYALHRIWNRVILLGELEWLYNEPYAIVQAGSQVNMWDMAFQQMKAPYYIQQPYYEDLAALEE